MGKTREKLKAARHDPLSHEILRHRFAQPSLRNKIRRKQQESDEFVNKKLTQHILKQAQQQREEYEEKEDSSEESSSSSEESDSETEYEITKTEEKEAIVEQEATLHSINEEEEKQFERILGFDFPERATLRDVLREKLTEKQSEVYKLKDDDQKSDEAAPVLNARKEAYFRQLVPVLSNYRSGKFPKSFKAIPREMAWEAALRVTEPDKWSSATMFQATRLLASNLKEKQVQRFYNLFLLPRLRDDIAENKSLNPHLYQALKKALFKPGAFFKGIIIPLVQSENCILREAIIFSSILAKCSIPSLHSSAALLTIAAMDYTGASSIFMRTLIEKKYALPYRVINGVVDHFLRFKKDKRQFPLLWHHCLLTFVQIYKADFSEDQRKQLLKLITIHKHEDVSPEIRKLLESETKLPNLVQQLYKM